MRRALLLSSILVPLAVVGASILLRHHGERSALLEGAQLYPFPPHPVLVQPPLSLLLRVCSSHSLSLCVAGPHFSCVYDQNELKIPSSTEFYGFFDGVFVFLPLCCAGVSFRSVSVAGVFFAGCSGGRRCTVLALEVGFFTFMLPF